MLVPASLAGQRGKLDVMSASNPQGTITRRSAANLLPGSTQENLSNKTKNGQQVFTFTASYRNFEENHREKVENIVY